MVMNLIVPCGEIKFVIYDGKSFFSSIISTKNYFRLTIGAGLYFAFQGIGENNILLNIASIEHDPSEYENIALSKISYDW